jgi:DNA-cytosine methyltransferase
MNILSLFDGMGCGRLALDRINIPVKNYFSSEIDIDAVEVVKRHYPNTIFLGSVTNIIPDQLPKIDLLIGGSPCQGFSLAGKQLNFEDPRSRLFFEYVKLLNSVQPSWFLLENVVMKTEWSNIISHELGVRPVLINSSLFSAQDRKRLYWTNIPIHKRFEDKKIYFEDILEESVPESFYLSDEVASRMRLVDCTLDRNKSCVMAKLSKYQGDRIFDIRCKASSLSANGGNNGGGGCNLIIHNGKIRRITPVECERLQTIPDEYTNIGLSDRKRFKMLGNGWTVDLISWILSQITESFSSPS